MVEGRGRRRDAPLIRTLIMLGFWIAAAPVAALIGFPWTFLSGKINLLYRMFTWGAFAGVRLAGVKVETAGLDRLDPQRTYIFMSNHVSNLDPPILVPLIPRRTSVMAKKELFSYPILGKAMRMGSLVPVVPVTMVGTHEIMPKARFAITPGRAKVIFHAPIEPEEFGGRDCLMEKVRIAIESGLVKKEVARSGK